MYSSQNHKLNSGDTSVFIFGIFLVVLGSLNKHLKSIERDLEIK